MYALCHDGDVQSCISCWADEVQGQMQTSASLSLSRPHWQHQDFMPTELETAFLKYKWRLVTVLIDGALQQRGAKIDERHMESEDWRAEEWCLWCLPSWTPQSSLINKWRRQCISREKACFVKRRAPVYRFHTNIIINRTDKWLLAYFSLRKYTIYFCFFQATQNQFIRN